MQPGNGANLRQTVSDWARDRLSADRQDGLPKNVGRADVTAIAYAFGNAEKMVRYGNDIELALRETYRHCGMLKTTLVVDTLDCQCLLVHSSLLERTRLRFDEYLTFDLYVEDFCMSVRERYGVDFAVAPLKCHHWSRGCVQNRYFDQLRYLKAKWLHVAYTGTAFQLIGGGGPFLWRAEVALKQILQHGVVPYEKGDGGE